MKWVWLIPSKECRPSNYIKYAYIKKQKTIIIIIDARTGPCIEELYI
jgi:hypothetical protein